ncbi:hypothetical protein QYE76_037845 [Lolium multiflorum]|uniref:3'-5' exonuclease n=1 Tax=Lolium multiflorum TaxID=4521 RepID=A0AAD8WQC1_LOLMU|nr:hypothetical protein QYE76_037845 [Lolium multiflorum]
MESGEPPPWPCPWNWDAAAEAELQAIDRGRVSCRVRQAPPPPPTGPTPPAQFGPDNMTDCPGCRSCHLPVVEAGVCIDDNDARKMFNDYDVSVQPLIGLSIIANVKLAGPHRRWSLAALTEMITCKELPNPSNIRMGNWESQLLSKQQLQYAATDAYISWYLYEVLQSLPDYDADAEKEIV